MKSSQIIPQQRVGHAEDEAVTQKTISKTEKFYVKPK